LNHFLEPGLFLEIISQTNDESNDTENAAYVAKGSGFFVRSKQLLLVWVSVQAGYNGKRKFTVVFSSFSQNRRFSHFTWWLYRERQM